MTASTFVIAAILSLLSAIWLVSLLWSIMSGPPERQNGMRWRERVLLALSVFLAAALLLSLQQG